MDHDDDKDKSLQQLSRKHRKSIIQQLVDIGNKRNQEEHSKFLDFITNLECLVRPRDSRLWRSSIDAFNQRQYVALSYTWKAWKPEAEGDRYYVQNWDNDDARLSSVRNSVFDRILGYMDHFDVEYLWIDAHCIRQETCGADDCEHSDCFEKRDALQAMDLVYQLSSHPVALLSWKLNTGSELSLLSGILWGKLVEDANGLRLRGATHVAIKALQLLSDITQDNWWWRAWTFQENYRGGTRMQLLMRHDPSLEPQKLRHDVFGEIPGELCIESVVFCEQATRLCLALRGMAGLSSQNVERANGVLRAAGKYTLLIQSSSSMTPRVIADIEARGLSKPWDRLAIIANCCQYPVRLNGGALSRCRQSLSLSILAMCLLNGVILDNDDNRMVSVANSTASKALGELMFQKLSAPEDDTRQLTFNKGCRLIDVKLTTAGITAKGHLWRLGCIIDTAKFSEELPWINEPRGRLELYQRRRLLQLRHWLWHSGYKELANQIDNYLVEDADTGPERDFFSFTEMWLHRMAVLLVKAIENGQKLRLGAIWNKPQGKASESAIFIWPDSSYRTTFAFTSMWQADVGSETYDANDLDRHVSLEVQLVQRSSLGGDNMPRLQVRGWLPGMCFFKGCRRTRVAFPWPRALKSITP